MDDYFGDQPAGATRSGVLTEDVESSLPLWIAAADQGDDLDVALALAEGLPAVDGDLARTVLRARFLLLLGRPAEAEAILPGHGSSSSVHQGASGWADFLALASRAAGGELVAYQGLLSAAAQSSLSAQPWEVAYVVSAAAEQFGDFPTARRAWAQLVHDHGIHTPLTLTHFTAGEVSIRDTEDAAAAARTVMSNAANFDDILTGPEPDQGPALAAAELLVSRGDLAGGRLLLQALRARHPKDDRLDLEATRSEPQEQMRRHRRRVILSTLLVIPLLPVGLGAVLALRGGIWLWRRRVAIPGLTLVDSRAWRLLRSVRFDPARQKIASTRDVNSKNMLGGVLGFCAGIFLSTVAVSVLGTVIDETHPSRSGAALIFSAVILCLFGGAFAGLAASRRIQIAIVDKRLGKREGHLHRQMRTDAKSCRCWQTTRLQGLAGQLYVQEHLLARPDLQGMVPNLTAQSRSTTIAKCPTTGTLWLELSTPATKGVLLLRGASPQPTPREFEPTGFYL